jgi:hypothetical protein
MSQNVARCLLLAALSTAGVAHARVVYVPLPPTPEGSDGLYETRVSLHNGASGSLAADHFLFSKGLEGTPRKSRLAVKGGETSELKLPGRADGLLRISADDAVAPTARMVGTDPRKNVDVELPVITDENRFAGGRTLVIERLLASTASAANLALVNLAQTDNLCTLSLATGDGAELATTSLTLRGLENRAFVNVFERLIDEASTFETPARASFSCDQDFYAYALVTDLVTGRIEAVTPQEATADQAVQKPTTVPTCPTGATCFDAQGTVFVPAPLPGVPVGRVTFPAPAGVAKRLRLSLDVTVADWYKQDPAGKNLIYWFVINKNIDMPGLLYFLGPHKNQAFARHGMGLTHPQKIKIIKPFTAKVGHTYHVDNDYDMANQIYTVTVTDTATGHVEVTLNGKPNVTAYTVKPGSNFLCDMGFFPNKVPTEVPSYKWKYANVHVEAYMK